MARTGHGALMRLWVGGALFALLILALAACFPQTMVTQPHLSLRIQNEAGEPLPAQVTLYWWEYPHRRQRAMSVVSADAQGTVAYAETTGTEVLMYLVPHGVPAYNWTFCIEAEHYKTVIGTISDVEPAEKVEATLILHRGESSPVCADYERLPYHTGTPVDEVEFSGGRVHGVYEVGAAP